MICNKTIMEKLPFSCEQCQCKHMCSEWVRQDPEFSIKRDDNCPLMEIPDSKEAQETVHELLLVCYPSISLQMLALEEDKLLDKLGFKKRQEK